jgi:hypothetical protein
MYITEGEAFLCPYGNKFWFNWRYLINSVFGIQSYNSRYHISQRFRLVFSTRVKDVFTRHSH